MFVACVWIRMYNGFERCLEPCSLRITCHLCPTPLFWHCSQISLDLERGWNVLCATKGIEWQPFYFNKTLRMCSCVCLRDAGVKFPLTVSNPFAWKYLDPFGGWKTCRNPLWRLFLPQCKKKPQQRKNATAAKKCRKSEPWLLVTSWLSAQQVHILLRSAPP